MKQYWKIGLVVAVVLAFGAMVTGIVAAQTSESTPSATDDSATATPGTDDNDTTDPGSGDVASDKETRRDEYLDALAANLGVTREALDQALTDTALEMVDQALADGKITEEEAANIKERINSGDFPGMGFGPHVGFGHGFEKGFHRGFHVGVKIDDLADFLGVEKADIREALANGQSLAEIAEANGKTRDELKAHIMSNTQERIDEAVANGDLTQEQADEKLQRVEEMVDNLINQSGPLFRSGPRFHRGGPGMFDHETDEEDGSTSDTETTSLTL
jgi:uncharacterized protein YidB (DUF937 family)